jgi:hypothetical protein
VASNDQFGKPEEHSSETAPTLVISVLFVLAIAAGIGIALFEESNFVTHRIDARVLVEAEWKLGEARECRTYSDSMIHLS